MKLKITLKDPDGVSNCIQDAAKESVEENDSLESDEVDGLIESRCEKLHETCKKWIRYGEYVTIEINTDEGTAVVIPV